MRPARLPPNAREYFYVAHLLATTTALLLWRAIPILIAVAYTLGQCLLMTSVALGLLALGL